MNEKMVALEGECDVGERIEITPDWESWVRFIEPKLSVMRATMSYPKGGGRLGRTRRGTGRGSGSEGRGRG